VLVTFNYRTGVFGFLAHPLLTRESPHKSSGNYGLLDIIAALRWVKDNIASFGGDPTRITLFGESSGVSAISLLLGSPLTEGLFEQVMLESPGAMRPIASLDNGEKAGQMAGCDLGRMRSLSAADVLGLTDRLVPAVRSLTAPRALGPVNDGRVLQGDERKAFASGRAHSVPLIVGGNADEGRSFIRSWPIHTVSEFNAFVEQNFAQAAPAALQVWTAKADQDVPDALSYMFADTHSTSVYAEWRASSQDCNQRRTAIFSRVAPTVNKPLQCTPKSCPMSSATWQRRALLSDQALTRPINAFPIRSWMHGCDLRQPGIQRDQGCPHGPSIMSQPIRTSNLEMMWLQKRDIGIPRSILCTSSSTAGAPPSDQNGS
jgi:carboxylesterase type B